MPGHSVLQLPVPELETWVVGRTRHYDSAFVSSDPDFAHAHVTALGPFDPDPSERTLAGVADVARRTAPITVTFADVGQFPDGIIHLRPTPDRALRDLTARLVARFPERPPYGGVFGPVVEPHLTLDSATAAVTRATTRALLGDLLPVTTTLSTLQLAWWESGACRVLRQWSLGTGSPRGSPRGLPSGSPGG